ncbi:hypothetical protein [Microbispora sp. NPDC049125]|uniref:hypothetical protein n=1 Tax=Microbispora sp. NPDC049125 TaxID=3154929 RepID=UPI0034659CB7
MDRLHDLSGGPAAAVDGVPGPAMGAVLGAAVRGARGLLGAVVFGCLLAAVTACASPGPGGDAPAPTGGAGSGGDQVELAAAADRIDATLRRSFPDHYAGVVFDPSGRGLIVYRRPSAALDAALRTAFAAIPVEVRNAPHAARELNALAGHVRGDVDHWRRRGITITSVAVRPDGTRVEVGTTDVAKAASALRGRYGPAPLSVVGEAGPTLIPGDG